MEEAWQAVGACFGRFCLTAGVEAARVKIGYQGGKVDD